MAEKLRVYVACAFARASFVDTLVVPMLERAGCKLVSTWHQPPWREREDLHGMPLEDVQAIIARNDHELATAEAVLVMADPVRLDTGEFAVPQETLCEARIAWSAGIPVVWEGHRSLSAFRPGVVRADSLAEAIATIEALALAKRRRTPTYPPPAMTGTDP